MAIYTVGADYATDMAIYTVGADYATDYFSAATKDYTSATTYSNLETQLSQYLYQPINEQTTSAIKSTLCNNDIYKKYLLDDWISPHHVSYNASPTEPADSTAWVSSDTEWGVKWDYTTPTSLIYHNYPIGVDTWKTHDSWYSADPKEIERLQKLEKIKSGLIIHVKSRANVVDKNVSESERIALDTLREVVSETEFRKYLKYGFVLIQGKSGDTYQVFRNKSHTKVWRNGELIEEICVRLQDSNVPATDNVIAFKAMIETSEVEFKKCGNVYKMKKAA